MTFELLPTIGFWVAGFIALAVAGALLAVAVVTGFVLDNRPVRVARQQSIPTYYRGLALSH